MEDKEVVLLSEKSKLEQAKEQLMAFALEWLAQWSSQDSAPLLAGLPHRAADDLKPYRLLLGDPEAVVEPGTPLLSIFSRIKAPAGEVAVLQRYWSAAPLSLEAVPEPQGREAACQADLDGWWQGFVGEAKTVLQLADSEARFGAFSHLLHRWAWAVPCSYGEPGVSLYDEFRALSALVHASGGAATPAEQFLLVGGDIPGIQQTIYTITSKGAAKGLRGRSFFIQLLGDAVVRRLLAELGLPESNLIYAAGGNFMLLAPMGAEGTVEALGSEINKALLAAFEGDLALCLAWEEMPAAEVGSGAFASRASRALKQRLAQQKRRRFAAIAVQEWDKVFAPQGQGKPIFCAVCQHEQQAAERGQALADGGWKCEQCLGFEELAQEIGQEHLLMFVSADPPSGKVEGWQKLLADLSGLWYGFAPDFTTNMPASSQVYSVNEPDFLGEPAQGFRFIANTTPRNDDGTIRTFEDLAADAEGVKKVGVLRMDVDDLGRVLTQWLPERTMASTSALSRALDRFFSGWLDAICREVMTDPQIEGVPGNRHDLLYVIYAGGDDLFVVGAWDLMPLLAERIRQRFNQYVGHHPDLHISAGITLEGRKFPLYQAAKRAGRALDGGAKEYHRLVEKQEVKKDALNFLGLTLGWEIYPFVKEQVERLIWLNQEQKVPHSLFSVLRAIYARYKENVRQAHKRGLTGTKMYYGPWMWRKVYQLSRIRQRCHNNKDVAQAIEALETEVLTIEKMPYIELATRWAEYLTREGRR